MERQNIFLQYLLKQNALTHSPECYSGIYVVHYAENFELTVGGNLGNKARKQ